MKDLIIVESPTKAKTIKNFLGNDYEVIASKGHVRDLPKHAFGIKIQDGEFVPEYIIDKSHEPIIKELKRLVEKSKQVYIATDEDREGEAIGFHIATAIGKNPSSLPRIVFHEITHNAILTSLKNPRTLDMDKVNAQQARRLLDRIVGYRLSPLIASKIQRGLSAGRVQSSALKIIVDREKEIRAFEPVEYFVIDCVFEKDLKAELIQYQGQKIEKLSIQEDKKAKEIVALLKKEEFIIDSIENKKQKVSPKPPFMTSTLQQRASSQLGFSPAKTMQIAQRLYEGVLTHKGTMGVITYMRTDSLNIAKEAKQAAREILLQSYGKEYIPAKAKNYATKSKSAQEAHEAIRPTLMDFDLELAKQYLKGDELKLYSLIYHRFMASQMVDAEFELQHIYLSSDHSRLKLSGRKLCFDGFYKLMGYDGQDTLLPPLKPKQALKLQSLEASKHQTEPPARYSEAGIIKTLESLGIGRPSTYAPTISLLASREYIHIEKKQLQPQEIAFRVVELLEEHFREIVDSQFTANLEEKLDSIAEKKQDWQQLLWDFYEPFIQKIAEGKDKIQSQKITIPTGEDCPLCGKELVRRNGRYGEFVGCSGYPKCKYIKQEAQEQGVCEKCGKPLVKKRAKRGEFLACSGYPECKNTKPLEPSTAKAIDVKCPKCQGEIVERMGKRGKFFGCANYPKCHFIAPHKPTALCCECGGILMERVFRSKPILECLACKKRIEQKES